jgi:hypothetical protein
VTRPSLCQPGSDRRLRAAAPQAGPPGRAGVSPVTMTVRRGPGTVGLSDCAPSSWQAWPVSAELARCSTEQLNFKACQVEYYGTRARCDRVPSLSTGLRRRVPGRRRAQSRGPGSLVAPGPAGHPTIRDFVRYV